MKLIIQKSIKYSMDDFLDKIINLDYVSAISLNVTKTKDDVLVISNLTTTPEVIINNIYNSSYAKLKEFEVAKLEDVIRYLNYIDYKGKVFINLIPNEQPQLTEEQNKLLKIEFDNYAFELEKILTSCKVNIYIHSASRSLLKVIKGKINCQFGFIITENDLNYIDVDYYIFTVDTLNIPLMKQQIDLGKDVLIYLQDDYGLSLVYDVFFGDKKTSVTSDMAKKIYLIGNYPEVFKKMFLE